MRALGELQLVSGLWCAVLVTAALGGGCRSFDRLGGVKLGEPSSAVLHVGADGRAIFVFSSVSGVCELADDAGGPAVDDWWVLSALVEKGWGMGDNSAEVYAKVVSGGEADEYTDVAGTLNISELTSSSDEGARSASGDIDVDFGDDGHVHAKFDAEHCGANLLQGL